MIRREATNSSSRLPLLIFVIAVLFLIFEYPHLVGRKLHYPQAQPQPIAPRGDLAADEQTTIELFRQAAPSVVYITTARVRRGPLSFNLMEIPQGTGSGFLWDEQGYVVTNFHVIQGADTAQVTLSDQSTWDARLVGAEPHKDLAVLKIDAPSSRLRPLPIGASQDLAVGQKVFAIGNPFGLDQTLTTGIISGLGREIPSVTGRLIQGVIQTDAAINPGNSGGPLLDSAGRLIGVNTAIYSPSGAYAGVGFAVPVDTVNRIVPERLRHGKVTRPGFGIGIAEDQLVQQLGLQGVLVLHGPAESAAARAGLRPTQYDAKGEVRLGDVIVAIDNKPVKTANDLFTLLEDYKVGDTVSVLVQRNGQRETLSVTLQVVQ
jgi:S1-C subfamily serine protease